MHNILIKKKCCAYYSRNTITILLYSLKKFEKVFFLEYFVFYQINKVTHIQR